MAPLTKVRLLLGLNLALTVLFAWLAVRDALLGRWLWMAIQFALMVWSGWRAASLLRLARVARRDGW